MALSFGARKEKVDVGPPMMGAIHVPGEPGHAETDAVEKEPEIPIKAVRVKEADFPELIPWLIPRLSERHPRASYEGVVSMLRAGTLGKHLYLVRTAGVVALAESSMEPLEPKPTVREKWLRCNKVERTVVGGRKVMEMTAQLRKEFPVVQKAVIAWAEAIGAVRVIMGEDTDLPVSDRYEADSRLKHKPVHILELGE